eukprot:11642255-Karenia_brevis.AAC.1
MQEAASSSDRHRRHRVHMLRCIGNVAAAERLSRGDVEVRAPREDEEMVRGKKRENDSSSESERSIGVRSHEHPSVGARRRRM